MERKIAKKIIKKTNMTSLGIFFLVLLGNILLSLFFTVFNGQESALQQIVTTITYTVPAVSIAVLITLSIVLIAQGLDYMISLSIPRSAIYRASIETLCYIIASIALVITIIIWANMHYGYFNIQDVFLFGIRGRDISAASYILFFYYVFTMGFLISMYCVFITMLLKRYTWHFLVSTILITLAIVLLSINEIALFFMTGEQAFVVFTMMFGLGLIIAFISGRMARRVEIKE